MNAVPQRSHFEIHRAAEYFSAKELSAQTGQPEAMFPYVVFKELVDNSLDAAEKAGIQPKIGIVAADCTDGLVISVEDNGPGIPPGLIAKILDFNTRTSDKAAYRGPTRGQQGNALKTIVGIAHVYDGVVIIESRGIKHTGSSRRLRQPGPSKPTTDRDRATGPREPALPSGCKTSCAATISGDGPQVTNWSIHTPRFKYGFSSKPKTAIVLAQFQLTAFFQKPSI